MCLSIMAGPGKQSQVKQISQCHLLIWAWLGAQVMLVCEGLCSVLSFDPGTVLRAELGLKALTPLIHSHEL